MDSLTSDAIAREERQSAREIRADIRSVEREHERLSREVDERQKKLAAERRRLAKEDARLTNLPFSANPDIIKTLRYDRDTGQLFHRYVWPLRQEYWDKLGTVRPDEGTDYVWVEYLLPTMVNPNGYRTVHVQGSRYVELLQRAIWWTVNGDPGESKIEFIDGDRNNCRIENLRATASRKRYQGRFRHQGEKYFLGYYGTLEEAEAAIAEAKFKLSIGLPLV